MAGILQRTSPLCRAGGQHVTWSQSVFAYNHARAMPLTHTRIEGGTLCEADEEVGKGRVGIWLDFLAWFAGY